MGLKGKRHTDIQQRPPGRRPAPDLLDSDAPLTQHAGLDRERTWSDETTHAIHESQTLRSERVHETPAHETAWTVAAYETPVSDRMWVLTVTDATPAPVIEELLNHLADGKGWDTAIGAPVDEKMVTAATQPPGTRRRHVRRDRVLGGSAGPSHGHAWDLAR
ncbi:DUF317 domain-containing protein [Streptomyces sp. NPDC051243]|uniref:DUF317 domain-containing protein n=1 Tax=Streptomyces sp. NPDC051243 TaxID=3365646 RepID=UPI0037BB520B